MDILTDQGKLLVANISQKYGLPTESIVAMLQALKQGGGTMAQFNIPALGGSGQWMQGGMTMVGDMFNYQLKTTVNNLCSELATLLNNQSLFKPLEENSNTWYPSELGTPTATGSQNNMRYAYFSQAKRLVVDNHHRISMYDTLDHQISGISQQQGNQNSVQFTSQYGIVNTLNLPLITKPNTPSISSSLPVIPESNSSPISSETVTSPSNNMERIKEEDIFQKIEKLGSLHKKGFLTDEEFQAKKTELLSRL